MEPSQQSGGGMTTSAIPRSKLPQSRLSRVPTATDGALSGSGAQEDSGLPRSSRNSIMGIPRPTVSTSQSRPETMSPRKNRQSMLIQPGFQTTTLAREQKEETTITSPMSTNSAESEGSTTRNDMPAPLVTPKADKTVRKPRPSLSDRTVETLAQIPPSPSPHRRQSGFYNTESPMKPPSRAASALDHGRPGSRMESSYTGSRIGGRPVSPTKRPASTIRETPRVTSPIKRPASSSVSRTIPPPRNGFQPPSQMSSRLQQPRTSTTLGKGAVKGLSGSKTMLARPSGTRSPVKDLFQDPKAGPVGNSAVAGLPRNRSQIKPLTPVHYKNPSMTGLRGSIPLKKTREADKSTKLVTDDYSQAPGERKVSSSSQSLREAIAKAKAAHRSNGSTAEAMVPRAVDDDPIAHAGPSTDPSSFDFLDSSHINILRKRVNDAKTSGKLNIAALCLTEIPLEVLKMYEPDQNGTNSSAWYENVDVTRLIAADNEITSIPEQIFESQGPQGAGMNGEDDRTTGIFALLEVMDLHGNQLKGLPISLGTLNHLTILNLSRNALTFDSLNTIARVDSLKELRIAENSLEGLMPECIGRLANLELLDLHDNTITELSSSLGKLSRLRTLNVSANRLSALPFEAIFDLPLLEIIASRNKLSGPFFPANIPLVPALQVVDISTNELTAVTEGKVVLPRLQSINISNNRVAALPDVSSWVELITLNAEENKISEMPVGFTTLRNLKTADFGNNSLLQLDDAIGSMESLTTLRIGNNPIRERRLLRLSTTDLKAELLDRAVTQSPVSERNGLGTSDSTTASWSLSGGVLDRSNTKLRTIEPEDLSPLAGDTVRSLLAHHNQLQTIPAALGALGATLTNLDLSHNKLGKSPTFLPSALDLPFLQSLNLTSNAMTTLEPLLTHLSAPKLTTLILLFNRLTNLPPLLTQAFPQLSKLLASNNALVALDVEAVRGVQVLDVSSNEIEVLPPRLALLRGQLRTLMVGGNRFKVPGWGVLEKGTDEILTWCAKKIPAGEEGALE